MDDANNPARRSGIQPWCPFHLEPMAALRDKSTDYYSCRRANCELHWRASSDYFRLLNGEPYRSPRQVQEETLCSKPGHGHKFISGTNYSNAIWECSVEGCTESEEKRIPAPEVWRIPKDWVRSAPAAIPAHSPIPSRTAAIPAIARKKRPGWVWIISLFYALGFLALVRFIFMFVWGTLPVTAQLREYLAGLGTFGLFMGIMQPLTSVSAAAALFLLRKEATYLFWLSLSFGIVSGVWTYAIKSGVAGAHTGTASSTGALIGIAIQLGVCFYVQQLKLQGTLR